MHRLPWDVLLLFGGGLSLAAMIRKTGLAEWIAGSLNILGDMPALMAIALVVTIIIFLTEVTSNTATTAAFLPPLGALAISLGMDPAVLAIPAAIAASCAFMLPVATTAQCYCLWLRDVAYPPYGAQWYGVEPCGYRDYYAVMSLAGGIYYLARDDW